MSHWERVERGEPIRCPHCTHRLMEISPYCTAYVMKASPITPPPDYGGNVKCPACRKHYLYQQEKVA